MTKEEMVQFALKNDDTVENTMWKIYEQGRADAVDEFYNRLLNNKNEINTSNYPWNYIELVAKKMANQLKEQDK